MIYVDLYDLEYPPHLIVSGGFPPRSLGTSWTWQINEIMSHFECDRDEIDLDDEDYITVRGERVAKSRLRVSATA